MMIQVSKRIVNKGSVAAFCAPIASPGISTLNEKRHLNIKVVPVAAYAKDRKTAGDATRRSILSVDESDTSPKAVSNGDGGRSAIAFDRSIAGKMTPTLKMFTLEGKVAVVTGYVHSVP